MWCDAQNYVCRTWPPVSCKRPYEMRHNKNIDALMEKSTKCDLICFFSSSSSFSSTIWGKHLFFFLIEVIISERSTSNCRLHSTSTEVVNPISFFTRFTIANSDHEMLTAFISNKICLRFRYAHETFWNLMQYIFRMCFSSFFFCVFFFSSVFIYLSIVFFVVKKKRQLKIKSIVFINSSTTLRVSLRLPIDVGIGTYCDCIQHEHDIDI